MADGALGWLPRDAEAYSAIPLEHNALSLNLF